jgi:hypothetical protein
MPTDRREAKLALLALVVVLVALFVPLLLRGGVIHPDDSRAQLGLDAPVAAANLGERRLGDTSNYYVPEAHLHLHGDARGWIATWNPHVALGRPASHLAGVSPAYLPALLLRLVVDDALVFHTLLAALTMLGAGFFLHLFLRAIGLSPWAAFAGGSALGAGVFSAYWAPFPIFVAGLCWTAAALWLAARLLARPSAAGALGLAFAVHALLLSAYPQQIVWHAWLVGAFVLARWWTSAPRSAARLGLVLGCALAGLVASAPVLADVAVAAARSARAGADANFFLASLPQLAGWREHLAFLATMVDAHVATDPLANARESGFNGVSLAPVFAGFAALALLPAARRRAALWLAFTAVALLLTLWPAAYAFAVEHLGLALSRFRPQAAAVIPLCVLAAIGVDAVLRADVRVDAVLRADVRGRAPAALLCLAPLAYAAACADPGAGGARWVLLAGAAAGLAAFALTRRPAFVPVLALASTLGWSAPLLVWIERDRVATDSPLVAAVRARSAAGTRYAIASERPGGVLPPNLEARLGLHSVHAYDPLAPESYRGWCALVSTAGTQVLGRWFQHVAGTAGWSRPEFAAANVGLVLSRAPLDVPALTHDGAEAGWHFHRPRHAPLGEAHVLDVRPQELDVRAVALRVPLQERARGPLEVLERRDDALRVRLAPRAQRSLLFVSRQHHPHWVARDGDGGALATVLVGGTFLGVDVPPGCGEVALVFEPWSRLAWIPHVIFAAAAALLAARALQRRRRSSTIVSAAPGSG